MSKLEVLGYVWATESSKIRRRGHVWGPQAALHSLPTGLSVVMADTEEPETLPKSFYI